MQSEQTVHNEEMTESQYSDLDMLIQQRMRSRIGRKVRPRNRILMAILEACRTPSVEHRIMINARVGYPAFCNYTDQLIKEGKMTCSKIDDEGGKRPRIYYTLTREGLKKLEELKSQLI